MTQGAGDTDEESRRRREATARNDYFRGQVLPRLRSLLLSPAFFVPILLGCGIAFILPALGVTVETSINDVATVGINYAALSFGGSVTGAVLAISLPSAERVRKWSALRHSGDYLSRYGDLVFSLTWAAMAQLAVLFTSIASVIIGGREFVIPQSPYLSHTILLALALSVFFYGAVQLFTVISVISQVGNVVDFEEWQKSQQPPR